MRKNGISPIDYTVVHFIANDRSILPLIGQGLDLFLFAFFACRGCIVATSYAAHASSVELVSSEKSLGSRSSNIDMCTAPRALGNCLS